MAINSKNLNFYKNLKNRDKFWINKFLILLFAMSVFIIIAFNDISQFNLSYIKEEYKEIETFKKQIEWAIKPYLEEKNYKELDKYCKDFNSHEDITFKIYDKNKKLIAYTNTKDNDKTPDDKEINFSLNKSLSKNKWEIYIESIKNQNISKIYQINTRGEKYYLKLILFEEGVIKTIANAQKNLLYCFIIYSFSLIIYFLHLFYRLRTSFNKLENSVVEIANGNLETKIAPCKLDLLKELTIHVQIMTKQLKNQIEKSKKLEEYKSNFIQDISHEIKTPITAINSAIELLETKNTIQQEDRECFNIILNQTRIINKLVQDILQLGELDVLKNNENLILKEINLNATIEDIINNFKPNNIKINLTANHNIAIKANKEFLITAISNLIINAIKYSNSRTIDIILSQLSDYIQIELKDYGIGIEKQHLNKIFNRFYRVDNTRSRKTGGSGLGLSIVKDIIKLHNGTIEVESEVNQGTNFIIKLPNK